MSIRDANMPSILLLCLFLFSFQSNLLFTMATAAVVSITGIINTRVVCKGSISLSIKQLTNTIVFIDSVARTISKDIWAI